jgi:phosphatidylserine/phosphatidylglycerophosphate/cardiolipin synthase-like enzyme
LVSIQNRAPQFTHVEGTIDVQMLAIARATILTSAWHGKRELRLICHNFCVFSVALPLALAALSLVAPAASIISNAAIAVCFAPEEDCAAFAVRAIDNAEREILVGAYGLTTGSGIVEALVRAKERGVDVRLIADKTTPCERSSGIDPLAAAGVPVWIDDHARIAHAKTMVIDSAVTLMGSMNWTRGAAANSEDLNLISSAAVAAAYSAHWHERLAASVRYARREDWCRVSSTEDRLGTR